MNKKEIIHAEDAPEPVGSYPHARRAGDFIFLSGVGPRRKGAQNIPGLVRNAAGEVVDYDFGAQCHAVFHNVKIILEASGAAWEDLVDVTVFLTNMKRDFKTFNEIYGSYLGDYQPCRTTVEVNRLPTPIAVELKCVAYKRSEAG